MRRPSHSEVVAFDFESLGAALNTITLLATIVWFSNTAPALGGTTFGILANPSEFTNGYWPQAALIEGADHTFYGVTKQGGITDSKYGSDGTVFKLTSAGFFTNLFRFNGTNGAYPVSQLLLGFDGALYGTTFYGGNSGNGTVFRITTNGTFTNLVSFDFYNIGAWPECGLIQDSAGWLYGTTSTGGSNFSSGTVFRISTNGAISTLALFRGANGSSPWARLIFGRDNNLYGTTYSGGAFSKGTIFQLDTNGVLTTLASLDGTNGWYCTSGLVLAGDGAFYGTALGGGPVNFTDNVYGTHGFGTIFRITKEGTLTALAYFGKTNGAYPYGGLVLGNDGGLYGTTQAGGDFDDGTVYRVATDGTLTTLHSFVGSDGSQPYAGLIQAKDGRFYGATVTLNNGVYYRLGFPMQPVFRALKLTGSSLMLTWDTVAGQTYQLQYATTLESPGWITLGNSNTATNGSMVGFDVVGQISKRFYRAVLSQ